jgi:ADP-ribose pyrophosphatase YjhB (NUDIX family)
MNQNFCAHCGQATEQRANNLFVCSNNHENWINAIPGGSCFILKDGKVLYGIRSGEPNPGGLDIPGGFIDLGETLEQATIREAKEELGVDIRLLDCLGSYLSDYDGREILNLPYVAEMVGGEPKPGDDMNGGDPVWLDIDHLPKESELSWPWIYAAQQDFVKWYHERNDR